MYKNISLNQLNSIKFEYSLLYAAIATIYARNNQLNKSLIAINAITYYRQNWHKYHSLYAGILYRLGHYHASLIEYEHASACELTNDVRSKIQKRMDVVRRAIDTNKNDTTRATDLPIPTSPSGHSSTSATSTRQSRQSANQSRLAPPSPQNHQGKTSNNPTSPKTPPSTSSSKSIPHSSPAKFDVFPLITIEGCRDLLGDDLYIESRTANDAKRVYQVKVIIPTIKPPIVRNGSSATIDATLMARCRTDSTHNDLVQVTIDFSGNRVARWECTCRTVSSSSQTSSTSSEHRDELACVHVGAALLTLKDKQDKQRQKEGLGTTHQAHDDTSHSLYIHSFRRLTPSQLIKTRQLYDHYSILTSQQLIQILSLNQQKHTGNKDELILRCIDGELYGILPLCLTCHNAHIFYANGSYWCYGHYDLQQNKVIKCEMKMNAQHIQRLRTTWKMS